MTPEESPIERAWRVRQENFPPVIEFDYPNATRAVSATGLQCGLDCAHCGGHFLEGMATVEDALRELEGTKSRPKSFLISGGCDRRGKVPWTSLGSFIERAKRAGRVNFHVGLVDEEEAKALSGYADAVSFDFVGDDETIHEVFGLDRTVEDYVRSYRALRRHTRVLPHICVGLRGGQISGEYRALEILKGEGAEALVFIVLIPTPGTRYATKSPPPLDEVTEILARARIDFPRTPILLGCMRPSGRYRADLDRAAVRCGVQKIVIPSRAAVTLAGELGLEVRRGEECCVL